MASIFDTIQSHIRDFEDQLYTACPAIVERYNPDECTVDVFPAIFKAEIDGRLIKDQMLTRVPLHFQSAREVGFTFPVQKGDTVLLIFQQADTENFYAKSDEFSAPKTFRKHSINDAIAIAGIAKYSNSPVKAGTENDVNIYHKGSYVRLKNNGDIVADTSSGQSVNLKSSGDVEVNASNNLTATVGETATVTATTVNISGTDDVSVNATNVSITGDNIDIGGIGGAAVARVGDVVTINSGSSAGTWAITSGSSKVRVV